MKYPYLSIVLCLLSLSAVAQNSLSATYTSGDIPTNDTDYDGSCNGPSAILSITLPVGDNYQVTNVHVEYDMTAMASGWRADQRSKIRCATSSTEESEVAGSGNSEGTYHYARDLSIANGTYPGATELVFEMWARRTWTANPGCNAIENKVDDGTWIITVYFGDEVVNPKVGVSTDTPTQTLDVGGKLKLADDTTAPEAGSMRWNSATQDFEGFDGTRWVSFTQQDQFGGWGDVSATETGFGTSSDGDAQDKLGSSVSISGDYAIIGADAHDTNGNNAQGKAYVFRKTGAIWTEEDILTASDGAANDFFGRSVSISGDYAIVGAGLHDTGGNFNQGKAYIFKRSGTTWNEEDILTASDGAEINIFGHSVSISGDYAVIGAYLHDTGGNTFQGKAYIFKRDGTAWSEQAILTSSDGVAEDEFGFSVSISGDYAVIGAHLHNTGGQVDQGKAYVFKRSGEIWSEQAILTASDGAADDRFGFSVAISGDHALVGAYFHDTDGQIDGGKAYIYKRTGTSWVEQNILTASDGAAGDWFGRDLSISGNVAVVGSPRHHTMGHTHRGKAYVYVHNGSIWHEQAVLTASDGLASDHLGWTVSASANNIIISANQHQVGANVHQGKVYFFEKN